VPEQNDRKPSIGPSFDCSQAQKPAQQVICASPELSREDLSYAQAYYAMRQQLGQTAWQSLKLEAIGSESTALSRCEIPSVSIGTQKGPPIGVQKGPRCGGLCR
jgi:hypothetical protein